MISLSTRVETFWENEKMLVISIFSFSHNVFKRHLFRGRLKSGLCDKELKVKNRKSVKAAGPVFPNHSLERSLSYSPGFSTLSGI